MTHAAIAGRRHLKGASVVRADAVQGSILVATNVVEVACRVLRVAVGMRKTRTVSNTADARTRLSAEGRWACVFVDARMDDGRGPALVAWARAHGITAPIVLLVEAADAQARLEASALDAWCLAVRARPSEMLPIVARAVALDGLPDASLGTVVERTVCVGGLSIRETELLLYALEGTERSVVLRRRGVSENTHRSQVRTMLTKLRAASLAELRARLLTEALRGRAEEPARPAASAVVPASVDAIVASLRVCRGRERLALVAGDVASGLWESVRPLLPPVHRGRRGRREIPARRVIAALLHCVVTGCAWRALPREFGGASTIRRHLAAWARNGVLSAVARVLAARAQ